jgi:glutaconate CoA-transferase subunit B
MLDVMGRLQQGRVDMGFLGAAEVDRFGNLNSTWGHRNREMQRLPGSGGACDIACLAKRTVVLLVHERGRLTERVSHITSPGYGLGNGWRHAQGLPLTSELSAIIRRWVCFDSSGWWKRISLQVHPGLALKEVPPIRAGRCVADEAE